MSRNKEVEASIVKVINDWMTADKNYSFEARIFGGIQFPKHLNGEAIMQFHIRIDGFFEDQKYQKPIILGYSSHLFVSSQLSEETPDNPNADAERLKAFLDDFTKQSYQKATDDIASYKKSYTSDPFYMK